MVWKKSNKYRIEIVKVQLFRDGEKVRMRHFL